MVSSTWKLGGVVVATLVLLVLSPGCKNLEPEGLSDDRGRGGRPGPTPPGETPPPGDDPVTSQAILLVIDEDSIDNGNEPNDFSEVEVNDDIAGLGQRAQLRYFAQNVGQTVHLYTGEVGDEGWHALRTIPAAWQQTGPTGNGARNFVLAGPGLGSPDQDDDREAYLDEIPDVTPLRAAGLAMLVGQEVLAVVYDSDVSINYSPLEGSLKGDNLGLVALRVTDIRERTDGSTGSLPRLTVEILDTGEVGGWPLALFANAPVPESSSEPYDTVPPAQVPPVELVPAP